MTTILVLAITIFITIDIMDATAVALRSAVYVKNTAPTQVAMAMAQLCRLVLIGIDGIQHPADFGIFVPEGGRFVIPLVPGATGNISGGQRYQVGTDGAAWDEFSVSSVGDAVEQLYKLTVVVTALVPPCENPRSAW